VTATAMGSDTPERFEAVIDLIAALAAGNLGARGEPGDHDDAVDAVLVGINMLAGTSRRPTSISRHLSRSGRLSCPRSTGTSPLWSTSATDCRRR
jgi:hypothetical protein